MNTNVNNIFITIVPRPNNVHVLENDFHLCGSSGLTGNYIVFPVTIHDKYELPLTGVCSCRLPV